MTAYFRHKLLIDPSDECHANQRVTVLTNTGSPRWPPNWPAFFRHDPQEALYERHQYNR